MNICLWNSYSYGKVTLRTKLTLAFYLNNHIACVQTEKQGYSLNVQR